MEVVKIPTSYIQVLKINTENSTFQKMNITSIDQLPLLLQRNKTHRFEIEKTETEYKLPKSYKNCTDSYPESGVNNYRQTNRIDICISKEAEIKYNCSFSSYYEIKGLKKCPRVKKNAN